MALFEELPIDSVHLVEVIKVREMDVHSHDAIHIKSNLSEHALDRVHHKPGFLSHVSEHFFPVAQISSHESC